MKYKVIAFWGIGMLTVLTVIGILTQASVGAGTATLRPTAAPTATPGAPVENSAALDTDVRASLDSQESVVAALAAFEPDIASWERPWSKDTFQAEPDRIRIEWHADRSYDGAYFGPGAETGPVWVIAIKGRVRLLEDNYATVYDGVTYTLGQKTGHLLQISSGLPVK